MGCCTYDAWCHERFHLLERLADVFVSVELTETWRLHIVFGKKDPKELIQLFTSRFASLSTMLTLLVSSQTAVFFSPSNPTEKARTALDTNDFRTVAFWAGLVLCLGIICSILALVATLTAWSIFVVIGNKNAHVLLKSSLCLHAAALPVRLAHLSITIFFLWINLFWYVVCSLAVALPLSLTCWIGMFHVLSVYGAVGRVIMYSGAIRDDERILEETVEDDLSAKEISHALVKKAVLAREGRIPIKHQYQIRYQEQLNILEEGGSLILDELRLETSASNNDNDEEQNRCGDSEEKKQE